MTTYWSFPTRVVFGVGAVAELGNETKRLGKTRALIVADKGVVAAKLNEPVEKALAAAGLTSVLFADVDPNPVEKNVHDGVAAYREAKADIIIALGGGSPLDAAKLIRLKAIPGAHERPLVDYDDATGGDAFITGNMPPMIAVPTTAGTGSEVGRSGVVQLDINHRKTVIFSPHLLPNVALLDPELTSSMPAKVTAATGFDALTHCLEAYLSRGDHPMADGIALEGLRLVAKHLQRAVDHPRDMEARGGMMKAAMMGAVAFQKGLGACHSLAHPLSSENNLYHGLANALCLPAVVAFNGDLAQERIKDVAVALGMAPSTQGLVEGLVKLRASLGLPSGLRAEGVTDAHLEKLADKAIEDACHRSNPREVRARRSVRSLPIVHVTCALARDRAASRLTDRAKVGGARHLSLALHVDGGPAAEAWFSAAFVDPHSVRFSGDAEGPTKGAQVRAHEAPSAGQDLAQLFVAVERQPREGIRLAGEQRLRLVDVADARHHVLQHQRVAQLTVVLRAQTKQRFFLVEIGRKEIRAQCLDLRR